MAPTVRQGQVRTQVTGYDVNQDRHVVDMLDKIYMYDPQSTPLLTVLTNRARYRNAQAFAVKHLEDEPVPEWDVTTAAVADGIITTIPVANGGYHRAGDILHNPKTGEGMRVESVTADDLTVERGYVGTAAAIDDAQQLLNAGGGEPEGDVSPVAIHTQTVTKENFTQIMKEPVNLSRTLEQVKLYGGKQRAHLRRKAGAKHARDWEQVLIWGKKKNDVSGTTPGAENRPLRLAGGLDEHIVTNELDAAGAAMSEAALRTFIGDCSRYKVDGSGGRKALVAGRAVIDTIESWGAEKLQTEPGGTKYGFQIYTWYSTYGPVDVVWHPLLEIGTGDRAFVVDMAGVMIRPLQRTILKTNIHERDEDGYRDEYLTEQSFSFINEKAFGRIKGVVYPGA